jgi:hypothetical protein
MKGSDSRGHSSAAIADNGIMADPDPLLAFDQSKAKM